MAKAEADAGGDRWSARYYELLLTRTTHPSSTKRSDARRWVSRGCYGSYVTGGRGYSADGNGGYGQLVATEGSRAHVRAEGQATPSARRRRPRRRYERIPGPDRNRLRLCRPRCLRCFGRTAEGDHGRASGSDGGYGRTVEAAAYCGRVLPAHNATQSRRPGRRRPTATGCPAADPDDHS